MQKASCWSCSSEAEHTAVNRGVRSSILLFSYFVAVAQLVARETSNNVSYLEATGSSPVSDLYEVGKATLNSFY